MKALFLICSGLLLISLADLPMGYYTLLRIVVSIGAIAVIIKEYEQGINFWIIIFGLILILFNPLIPIYLNEKEAWMPIDIIAAILFGIKSFSLKSS
ncbi:MAG: hypothetical protein RBT49_18430 [Bacteroidales bacterium]|jgi:hypothetical protein|nr:hypothetical protein [Bacteroidales bacterium]